MEPSMSITCFLFHFALNLLSKCSITALLSSSWFFFWNHVAQASLKRMPAPKYCDYRQAPLHMALCFHFVVLQFVLNFVLQKSNMEIYLTEGVCVRKALCFLGQFWASKVTKPWGLGLERNKKCNKKEVQETFTRPTCALGPISTAFQGLNNAWFLLYPFSLIIHPEISLSISTLCQPCHGSGHIENKEVCS